MRRSLLLLSIALLMPVSAHPVTVSAGNSGPTGLADNRSSVAAEKEFQQAHAAYQRGDYRQEIADLRQLAAQGYTLALSDLCVIYGRGQGVPRDFAKARKLCRLAAARGDAYAEYNLGLQYLLGFDAEDSAAQTMSYLRAAASSGDAEVSTKATRLLEVLNATPRNTVGNEDCRLALLRDAPGKGRGILAAQEVLYVNHFAQSLGYNNLQTLFAIDGQHDGMLVALKYCGADTSLATALDILALSNGY